MDRIWAQKQVQDFWNSQPCDSELSDRDRHSREYFLEIERRRYELQPHILDILSKIDWRGKRVLEIGTGVGTDARNIIGRGGIYTGIKIGWGSTDLTLRALRVFLLPGIVLPGNAILLVFPDGTIYVVKWFR